MVISRLHRLIAPSVIGRDIADNDAINDDAIESKRVELFPLSQADNQAKVRLRFAQAGSFHRNPSVALSGGEP